MGLQLQLNDVEDNSEFGSEVAVPLPPTEAFSQAIVRIKSKAELGPQKDNSPIEHRVG
jgi:hypothetical protein